MSSSIDPQTSVKIRLVETYYRNRLEPEDGPGSLMNVVSDATHQRFGMGYMTLAEAKAITRSNLWEYGRYCEQDSADGFHEYSYRLEYLDPQSGMWRLVNVLW